MEDWLWIFMSKNILEKSLLKIGLIEQIEALKLHIVILISKGSRPSQMNIMLCWLVKYLVMWIVGTIRFAMDNFLDFNIMDDKSISTQINEYHHISDVSSEEFVMDESF